MELHAETTPLRALMDDIRPPDIEDRLLAAVRGPAATVETRTQLSSDHPYGVRVQYAESRYVTAWLPVPEVDHDAT